MENLQQHRDKVETARRETREAQAWWQFLTQHPEISNVEANRLMALEYHNGSEMTLGSLLDSLNSPAFRATLAFVNPQKEREESLATIKRITGEIPLTAKYETNETLARKAAELEQRRELSKKSPDELRQIIKDSTPVVTEDDLPKHMDRTYLLGITKQGEFKRICERYGVAAVTRRLNDRR